MRSGKGSWADARNREIAIAFTIYKRQLHRCGYPIEKAFSGSVNGWIQTEWVKCNYCDATEKASIELGKDDERHGRAWAPIPVDHFPYGDKAEPFDPWALKPRELDI